MVGAITASRKAGAEGGMGLVGAGFGSGFGFGRIAPCGETVAAVAEPRATAIPAKSACELPSVAGAGLVRAGHKGEIMVVPTPAKRPAATFVDGE